MGLVGPLLNRSELSVRKGVLLYMQLIRPMMDYACHVCRSAACTDVRRQQVLQAPWYFNNRLTNEDLGVPFFTDILELIAIFDSRFDEVGIPLVWQLGKYVR
jgi:hypothetical protein